MDDRAGAKADGALGQDPDADHRFPGFGIFKDGLVALLFFVIAPGLSETWFYKLMGDEQIVEQQKDTFTKFIQTAKFGN